LHRIITHKYNELVALKESLFFHSKQTRHWSFILMLIHEKNQIWISKESRSNFFQTSWNIKKFIV